MSRLFFEATEAFEIALRIEQNGARFYKRAAASVPPGALRDVLAGLGAMEDDHEVRFEAMLARVAGGADAPVFDPDDQTALYLCAMADGNVFGADEDFDAVFAEGATPASILEVALAREKDAVVFFSALRESAKAARDQEAIGAIVREEVGHVGLIGRQLATLKGA